VSWKVCSTPGCPELVDREHPCAKHGRPLNARWSKGRDGAAQNRFRAAVLARDGHRCTRCGSTWNLHAHHVKPGYDVESGVTLCGRCHGQVDKHARS
jgi:5-methylcytosine-specific restriction endonuclease McrA